MEVDQFEPERLETIEDPVQCGRVAADDTKPSDAAIDGQLDILERLAQLGGHLALDSDVEDSLAHTFSTDLGMAATYRVASGPAVTPWATMLNAIVTAMVFTAVITRGSVAPPRTVAVLEQELANINASLDAAYAEHGIGA